MDPVCFPNATRHRLETACIAPKGRGLLGLMAPREDVTGRPWETIERRSSHAAELEVDLRAEMLARQGYEPLCIVEMVLRAEHDDNHLAGLQRARAIGDLRAASERPIRSVNWKRLTRKGDG
ncbi:hypothetical protein DYH09_08245 [bacterium CPR1]|nr:hypothetical protein [bacterium CPR1]